MEYAVKMAWDDRAAVWVATSEDIPGLVLESRSVDTLIEKVRYAIPELLRLNNLETGGTVFFQIKDRFWRNARD